MKTMIGLLLVVCCCVLGCGGGSGGQSFGAGGAGKQCGSTSVMNADLVECFAQANGSIAYENGVCMLRYDSLLSAYYACEGEPCQSEALRCEALCHQAHYDGVGLAVCQDACYGTFLRCEGTDCDTFYYTALQVHTECLARCPAAVCLHDICEERCNAGELQGLSVYAACVGDAADSCTYQCAQAMDDCIASVYSAEANCPANIDTSVCAAGYQNCVAHGCR